MVQGNTVRQFRADPAAARLSDHEGGQMEAPETKRLNLNLPKSVFDELGMLAKASGRTMTEIVRIALGLVAVVMNEKKSGHKIMITDHDGTPIKELVLPR